MEKAEGKPDHMKDKLDDLTSIISKVYLPLMDGKTDLRLSMEKFVKQVSISMQQAYGNISIKIPDLPENAQTEDLANDPAIIEDLIDTIVSCHSHI
jgi:hypothetical protein